jgi:peptidoglycan glycosyltransferase
MNGATMPRAPRPVSHTVVRVGVVLSLAFGVLAAGAGYWQVAQSAQLVGRPDDPAIVAARLRAPRGTIIDRTGVVLAQDKVAADGTRYRTYVDRTVSQVVGYASRRYGTAGLERTYDAELTGLQTGDPRHDAIAKFLPDSADPQDLTLSLSLALQRQAVTLLGKDRGAVVMLDPRTGDVLALASTPTYDASAISNPATADAAFKAVQADPAKPLLPRATQGLYVPGSVFKIVTGLAALGSGAITPATTYPQQPAAEKTGLLVDGYRVVDGHHPQTDGTALDYDHATEVSCNIYYALAGLDTGGAALVDYARRIGFGAPLPFDLPTARSQVTNGGGPLPGGFKDDVELANAAYGQAETLVTPLQMALVAATVANGGLLMQPRLVTSMEGQDGSVRQLPTATMGRVVSPTVAGEVRDAMVLAVNGSLGKLFTTGAALSNVVVAGKSGTAQLGGSGEPHSWFIGFAPAKDPQVAIAVLVEQGGRGGARAAPLAGKMLSAYFALPASAR